MGSHGPIKTFVYHSNFHVNGELKAVRIPDPDIQRGVWEMNIRSFCWSEQKTTTSIQEVSCSWIKSLVLEGEGQLRYAFAPLELMQCAQRYNGRLQFSDPSRWLEVNNLTRELQFQVLDARTRTPLASDEGDFLCLFALRRIR